MMYAMADTDLGLRIRRARERQRVAGKVMTQEQLAVVLGVGVRSVGRWERGEAAPRNAIGALEEFLGIDLTEGSPDPERDRAEMHDSIDRMDAAQLAKLVEAYRAIRNGNSPRREGAG